MKIDRRNFLRVLGITGASLAVGNELQATPKNESEIEFYGILYDSTRCVGCQSCEFA
jgi:formate dehydrogenase iron-sulfur subunit